MANRERGETRITVGGREYTLRMSLNAECELEDRMSSPTKRIAYGEILGWIGQNDRRALRAFFWAALQEHHRAEVPTLEAAGELITAAGGANVVLGAMAETVRAAQPDTGDLEALNGSGEKRRGPGRPRKALPLVSGSGPRSTVPLGEPG